jgi:transcriptional regulator with XRE-family HTH domain
MHLGKAIRNLRLLSDLTQLQLAKSIGKTKGLISQIEKNGRVNYYTLLKIAEVLQTTPEKITQYQNSLEGKAASGSTESIQKKLPDLDLMKLENHFLKEQILLLKKTISLLESKIKG